MKKSLSFLLAFILLLSLTACAQPDARPEADGPDASPADTDTPPERETPPGNETPTAGPGALHFTRENFPRLDGSTSMAPMAQAVCVTLLGVDGDEAKSLVNFNRTTNAYFNLIYGNADLLIAAESNDEVEEARVSQGFEWDKTPFATDAFVFVVNEANPVDSITVEEARRIYTGEIKNWSELGGEDREIIPFQRDSNAGSQTLMEKLVMNGEPMMDAPTDYIVTSMGELMEAVRSYDNSPGAIGYSVYYYAEEMRMAQGLKLLKINGVEPADATIRSGVYPLTNPMYVVIASSEPADSPARLVYDWILSENGQRLAAREGYVSIMDFETSPREIGTQPLIGARWYEDYTDTLLPRGDYGLLIPYAGARLSASEFAATGCLYGLMTRDGRVVMDPVCAQVNYPWHGHPLLILRKGGEGGGLAAVAAEDGSWCTGFDYQAVYSEPEGLLLHSGDAVTLMRPDGSILTQLTPQNSELTEELLERLLSNEEGGDWFGDYISLSYDDNFDIICCQISTGKIVTMSDEDFFVLSRYEYPEYRDDTVPGAYRFYDEALGTDAPYLLMAEVFTGDGNDRREYYRADGTLLPELTTNIWAWYEQVSLRGGLIERLDLNTASYYDLTTMKCVFRAYLNYETD